MPLPVPPFEIVAEAVVQCLRAFPWGDYVPARDPEAFEQEGAVVPVVRHWRAQYAEPQERPAILVRIDSDDPNASDTGDSFGVCGELRMDLGISLIIDAALATAISEADQTGLGQLGGYCVLAMRALKADPDRTAPLYDVCDSVADAGRGPDADNSSDEGRLVQSAIVGYRVLEDDPTVLLHRGANA